MEEVTINFKYHSNTLRQLYYDNGKRTVFSFLRENKIDVYFLCLGILYFIVYLFAFSYPQISFIIFFIGIALLVLLMKSFLHIYSYIKWKKSVEIYINKLVSYKLCKMILTDKVIEFNNDDETIISKWEYIQHVKITDTSIKFQDKDNLSFELYSISVSEEEYNVLKSIFGRILKE